MKKIILLILILLNSGTSFADTFVREFLTISAPCVPFNNYVANEPHTYINGVYTSGAQTYRDWPNTIPATTCNYVELAVMQKPDGTCYTIAWDYHLGVNEWGADNGAGLPITETGPIECTENKCQQVKDLVIDDVTTAYPAANTCIPMLGTACLSKAVGPVGVIFMNEGKRYELTDYVYTGEECDPNAPEFNNPQTPIEQPVDPINPPGDPPENPNSDHPGEAGTPEINLSGTPNGSSGTSQTSTVQNGDGTSTTTTTGTISNSGTGQGMTGSGQGYGDSSYNHQETIDPVTQEKTESDNWNSGATKYEPPDREIDFSAMNDQLDRLSASGPVQLFNTLKNIVSILSGTPKAPEFVFNVFHHEFEVSLKMFDPVAVIFRSFMAIIIAIGTIYFIFKQWGVTS